MLRDKFDHGFGALAWSKAKQEAIAILKQRAKSGDPITYSDFVNQLRAVRMDAHDPRLAHFLGEISSEEHEAGRPLITALIVHKHDMRPGKGFFELARSLGFSFVDEVKFWSDQISVLQRQWR